MIHLKFLVIDKLSSQKIDYLLSTDTECPKNSPPSQDDMEANKFGLLIEKPNIYRGLNIRTVKFLT